LPRTGFSVIIVIVMLDPEKMGLWTRLRLCWTVFFSGKYDPEVYRTRHAQKQWNVCEQRRRDLEATHRPREDCPESEFGNQ